MRDLVRAVIAIWSAAFFLNLAWEFAHTVLYRWPARITVGEVGLPHLAGPSVDSLPVTQFIAIHFFAACMDASITALFLLGGMAIFRSRNWWQYPTWMQYGCLIAAGFFVAVWIEYRAVYLVHAWSYTPMMPTIAGIGITPVLQMMLLPALSLWIARRFSVPRTPTGHF